MSDLPSAIFRRKLEFTRQTHEFRLTHEFYAPPVRWVGIEASEPAKALRLKGHGSWTAPSIFIFLHQHLGDLWSDGTGTLLEVVNRPPLF